MCTSVVGSQLHLRFSRFSHSAGFSAAISLMAWSVVGFHAMEMKTFQRLMGEEAEGDVFHHIYPMEWCHNPLSAIERTKKNMVRQLGQTPSDPAALNSKGSGAKAKGIRGRKARLSDTCLQALEQPNYVVFRLKTQENMAHGHLIPKDFGFEMKHGFHPFGPLQLPGMWELDLACLVIVCLLFLNLFSTKVNFPQKDKNVTVNFISSFNFNPSERL